MTILTCLGDSITDCDHCFTADFLGNGYVQMLSKRFEKEGISCQVRNYGTDGFTVNRLLQRIKCENDFSSNIITILIGINDISMIADTYTPKEQQSKMLISFKQHYTELLTILTKSTSHIILMEPFLFSWPAFYETWLPLLSDMWKIIKELAESFQLPYVSFHEKLNEEARRYGYASVTIDGIHLTEQGQKFIADKLYPLLLPYCGNDFSNRL